MEEYADEVSPFLYAYTQRMNGELSKNCDIGEEYKKRFIIMLDFVKKYFPNGFARVPKAKVTPRTRFEAIAIGSYLAYTEKPNLVPNDVTTWLNSDTFKQIIRSDGANVIGKLKGRIGAVKENLLKESK